MNEDSKIWQCFLELERGYRVTNFMLSFGPHTTTRCCFCQQVVTDTPVDGPIMCKNCTELAEQQQLPLQLLPYDKVYDYVQTLKLLNGIG